MDFYNYGNCHTFYIVARTDVNDYLFPRPSLRHTVRRFVRRNLWFNLDNHAVLHRTMPKPYNYVVPHGVSAGSSLSLR